MKTGRQKGVEVNEKQSQENAIAYTVPYYRVLATVYIIDCYGIPGSKRLLVYMVPYYRKWYHPLTRYIYRVNDDNGTENAVIFTVQSMVWQRTKPRLQLVIRILDPIDQYTTHSL